MPDTRHLIQPIAWLIRETKHGKTKVACGEVFMREDSARRAAERLTNSWRTCEAFPVASLTDLPEEAAQALAAMEQRALRAEELLSSMMKGGELLAQALGEAGETFGFLHACMFGAEAHLREHGWIKPPICNCASPPTLMSDDCPIHGLEDERPF